jgi:hypothetical protein
MKNVIAFAVLALCAQISAAEFKGGRWKNFVYDKPDKLPVIISGESRCENVEMRDYCLYLDVWYADGTPDYGVRADFMQGTHDWEQVRRVFLPRKPVAKIEMFALCRKGAGKAVFRNLSLERREGRGDKIDFIRRTDRPYSDSDELAFRTFTGYRFSSGRKTYPAKDPSPSTVAPGRVELWVADSMRAVSPLTFPKADDARAIELELAGRERESVQICFSAAADAEWTDAVLKLPELRRADGVKFKGRLDWRRIGYLPRESGYLKHPHAMPENEKWFPDPLLPPAPFKVRKGGTQGAWLTVYAAPEAKSGVYTGNVEVRAAGGIRAAVPMTVRVRAFSLPEVFGLETAYSVMDGFIRKLYPEDFKSKKREAWDIMLDHRLNPDDISRTSPPEIEDLVYARKRGMNRFNVLNIVPPPKNKNSEMVLVADPEEIFSDGFYADFVRRARPCIEAAEARGLGKLAYFYGFDERGAEFYAGIEKFWRRLQKDFPGVPLMSTAKNYRDLAAGRTNIAHLVSGDWYCPVSSDYSVELNRKLRAGGRKVWWYTCCGPCYPYANMASWEYPPVEARILGWMTYQYRADGYLFWIVNKWYQPKMDGSDTYFPQYRTRNGNGMPGDGILMYPGADSIWPSIKLANCRDAEEDYEYLQLAAELRGEKAADEISKSLVESLVKFTRDPKRIRAARRRLAELIERGR